MQQDWREQALTILAIRKGALLSEDERRELIVNGRLEITMIPSVKQVQKMNYQKLVEVLRTCPYSDFFGRQKAAFSPRSLP